MALYSDLAYDSRVLREAGTLARAGYDVTIACLPDESQQPDLPEGTRMLAVRPTAASVLPGSDNPFFATGRGRLVSLARRIEWLQDYVRNLRSWGRQVVAACGPVDIWHVHDLTGLAAIGPLLASDVPVVYDAHELFLETGTALRLPKPARRLLRAYERRLISRVSAVVTVNDGLAAVIRRRYRPARLEVVHNCPDRWSQPLGAPSRIRDAAGIRGGEPVILYHGALGAERGIEQLMDALLLPGLADSHLVLLGFGPKRDQYVDSAGEPRWRGRVHVLDPVPPSDLLSWIASATIGAMPIQASTLNHYLTTPNKLFECLAAGVPVVASDFPAMRRIVLEDPDGPLGTVCDPSRVEDLAAALRSLLELEPGAYESLRARCAAAAAARWNWETESGRLTALYAELAPVPS